jgi:hypothetical protein
MPQKIRVNTANEQELLEVPGLRPADASAIVRFRDEHGPIKDAAQLSSVLGGRELDETTRQRVDFDGGPRQGPPNPPAFGAPRHSRGAPLDPAAFGGRRGTRGARRSRAAYTRVSRPAQ